MKRVFQKVKADKRILIGYSASLVLLLVTYIFTIYVNGRLKAKTADVEHTYKLVANLEILLSRIKDGETGVRGYALTRDETFLAPYNNSRRETDSLFKIIVSMSAKKPAQLKRLDSLEKLIDTRFSIFVKSINYYKTGATDTSFDVTFYRSLSRQVMDEVRHYVGIIQKEERQALESSDAELKSVLVRIDTITAISIGLTLLLLIVGFITYTRENKEKKVAMSNIKVYQQQLSNRVSQLSEANAALIQMRRMEKFAATGRIARTIAHEVRNPLTNINLANSQLKSDIVNPDENIHHLLDIIERNSNRINKLISDLLQSTKFTELKYTTVAINKIIEESLAMAEDRVKLKKIKVETKFGADCNVKVDLEKIKIPFLNIIINAIEAMEQETGVLQISTRKEGGKCIITISDNGSGMDEAALSKLFEPYFTSKPKGNGLGLTNTQNIILNHRGTINVQSEVGKGTTFYIELLVA